MGDNARPLTNAVRRTILAALGARLRNARTQAGFKQEEVARNIEVSTQSVRNWEAGRTEPSTERLQRMSLLYNVPVAEFQNASLAPRRDGLNPQAYNRVRVDPNKLRLARVQADLTRTKAGIASGISESSIARYEKGEAKPKPDRLMALARAYGKPATWFASDKEADHVELGETSPSICEKCSTPIDDATIAYATAHSQLSSQAVFAISEFIAFVHQREIRRNAPEIRGSNQIE